MTPQLVDVVIPTRNRLELTIAAARLVQAQTYRSWRLFIVDDGSDPEVVLELRRLAAEDERIRLIERSVPGGPQAARQTGFVASDAPFVAFLDSDDLWIPTKLEKQLQHFEAKRADLLDLGVVICSHYWINMDGVRRGRVRRPRVDGRAGPLVSNNMSTILARREAVVRAGGLLPEGQRSLRTCEHTEFYMRLTQQCDFSAVDEALVLCREHAGERASDALKTSQAADELAYVLELHRGMLVGHPRELSLLQAQLAARSLEVGDLRRGLSQLGSSLTGAGAASAFRIARQFGPYTARVLLTAGRRRREASTSASTYAAPHE